MNTIQWPIKVLMLQPGKHLAYIEPVLVNACPSSLTLTQHKADNGSKCRFFYWEIAALKDLYRMINPLTVYL